MSPGREFANVTMRVKVRRSFLVRLGVWLFSFVVVDVYANGKRIERRRLSLADITLAAESKIPARPDEEAA